MKPIHRLILPVALALMAGAALARAQDRRGGTPQEPPTLRAKVSAYEADRSITLETKVRGGGVEKTEFAIVKEKTKIELLAGVKAVEPGMIASVWTDKDNPKNAARIAVEPEPPTAKGKVTAHTPDVSLALETPIRNGGVQTSEFSLVKGKTQLEGTPEVGMTVSVWADKENPKNAARVVVQGSPAPARGRRGAPPPAPAEPPKPTALPDVPSVLKAYKDNLPTDKKLEWYSLDWVNSLGEAKERAARENRPILFIHTNKEGDLFCSLC